jgi:hypothetical protein
MCVSLMFVTQMSVNQMSVDQMSVSQMFVSQMSASQMSFNKCLVSSMFWQNNLHPNIYVKCLSAKCFLSLISF